MDVAKIQREVRRLPTRERKKLTAWMVAEFPVRSVDRLVARAAHAPEASILNATARRSQPATSTRSWT
jgi:hypothetical protein